MVLSLGWSLSIHHKYAGHVCLGTSTYLSISTAEYTELENRAEDSVPRSTVHTWHSSLSSQPCLSPLLTTLRIHITVCACGMGKGVILPESTRLGNGGLDPGDSSRSLFSFCSIRKYMLLDVGRHLEEALCISC